MTRKRFIRLVMSCGVQKNDAARMAQEVAAHGSYDRLFGQYRFRLAFRPLDASLRELGKTAKEAATEFEQFAAAMGGFDLASRPDRVVITHYSNIGIEFEEI